MPLFNTDKLIESVYVCSFERGTSSVYARDYNLYKCNNDHYKLFKVDRSVDGKVKDNTQKQIFYGEADTMDMTLYKFTATLAMLYDKEVNSDSHRWQSNMMNSLQKIVD